MRPFTLGASQMVLLVKDLPANARDLGFNPWVWQIPWRRKMATHSDILAEKFYGQEEPGGLQFTGSQRVGHN